MKKRGNIVALLCAEAKVALARTPEAREEAAADVVVTKFIAGMRITEADAKALELSAQTAERMARAARKVG